MNEPNIYSSGALDRTLVREVLKYVPLFSGRIFMVAFNVTPLSDTLVAEILLDLVALQRMGVRLILANLGGPSEHLLHWAMEVELKLSVVNSEELNSVLGRGQAALLSMSGCDVSESLVQLAQSICADKVLYLGETEQYPISHQEAFHVDFAEKLFLESSFQWVLRAVKGGVKRVHLLDAFMPGCLSQELFSNEGVGLMVYADSYHEIRALTAEDISELLAIIGRSVRSEHLVPRTYEAIESQLSDYYVLCIDGHVIGSVALHAYDENVCELACLFVKDSHKGFGYGRELVSYAEKRAQGLGFKSVFALTTEASHFFHNQLGYTPTSFSLLPQSRVIQLQQSGRHSVAFVKDLSS